MLRVGPSGSAGRRPPPPLGGLQTQVAALRAAVWASPPIHLPGAGAPSARWGGQRWTAPPTSAGEAGRAPGRLALRPASRAPKWRAARITLSAVKECGSRCFTKYAGYVMSWFNRDVKVADRILCDEPRHCFSQVVVKLGRPFMVMVVVPFRVVVRQVIMSMEMVGQVLWYPDRLSQQPSC